MPRGGRKIPILPAPGGVSERDHPGAVPPGKWLASSNFLVRDGRGQPRPGYERFGVQVAAANRVLGIGFHGSRLTEGNLVVHTISAAYEWDGSAFNAITGTWTSSNANEHVRFTSFIQAGTLHIIRTNIQNALDSWTGTGSFADVGGTPPSAKDVTTATGRVVTLHTRESGTTFPRRVRWSNFNDMNVWSAADFTDLIDTPDEVVAGRSVGPLSFAVWKEHTLWLGVAQAALAPFQFQLVSEVPGPPSPAAVISHGGSHYWLAHDGVIYRFDGARVEAVGTDLSRTLQGQFDWENRDRVHGTVLELAEPELWLFIPRSGGILDRALHMNLVTGAMAFHALGHDISASAPFTNRATLSWDDLTGTWDTLESTFGSWDEIGSGGGALTTLFGDVNGNFWRFNVGARDDTTAIPWNFETGWMLIDETGEDVYVDGIQSYWRETGLSLSIAVELIASRSLSDADTGTSGTIDPLTTTNHQLTYPNVRGKWVKVKHSATSSLASLEFRGALLTAWPRRMP